MSSDSKLKSKDREHDILQFKHLQANSNDLVKQTLSAKLCQLCQQFSAKIVLNLAQIMAEGYEICFSQTLINQMHDTTLEKQQWRCRELELS